MPKPRRKRYRPKPESDSVTQTSTYEYARGYVLVHGIGATKPGSTLQRTARSAADLLREVFGDRARWSDVADIGGQRAATLELSLPGGATTRFLFVESRWTELTAARRFTPTALWWTLLSTLTLLPYLLGPGAKEMGEVESRPLDGAKSRKSATGPRIGRAHAIARTLGTMLWRVSVLGTLIALVVWIASQLLGLAVLGAIIGAALICTIIGILALSKTDLAGQVRVVATQPEARAAVLDSIGATVTTVEAMCDRVTLVGHSQGGYLAYQLLRDRGMTRLPKTRTLIGVGSGLRPIHILSSLGERRAILGTLLFAAGAGVVLVAGYLLNRQEDFSTFPAFPSTGAGSSAALLDWTQGISNWLMKDWLDGVPLTLLLLAGLGIVAFGSRVRKRFTAAVQQLPDLPSHDWEEWSTPNDIVARFALPELPKRTKRRYLAGSHTLFDHFLSTYFRSGGTSRLFLARDLVLAAQGPRAVKDHWMRVVRSENDTGLAAASRWYDYRGYVQLCVLVAFIVVPALFGAQDIFSAFARVWPVFLVTGVISTVLAWIAVGRRSRRDQRAAVRLLSDPGAVAPRAWFRAPDRDRWTWIRSGLLLVVFGMGWLTTAALVTAASANPGVRLITVAFLVYSLGLGIYFSAVAADFAVPAWLSIVLMVVSFSMSVIAGPLSFLLTLMTTLQLMADIPLAFVRRSQRRRAVAASAEPRTALAVGG